MQTRKQANTWRPQLLLENDVDVNYRVSEEDPTPLMYAVNSGNSEIVAMLLDRGADTAQTMKAPDYLKMGKKEVNACDFAVRLEKPQLMTLLKCADTSTTAE